jgi:hypothetical protein
MNKKAKDFRAPPIYFCDPLRPTEKTEVDINKIVTLLSCTKEEKDPTYGDLRQLILLTIALPTEIENPLFLMTFVRSLQYFPSTLLELMTKYSTGEIQASQFAHTLKAMMMDKKDSEPFSLFEYINGYINTYDVFRECG